MPLINVIEKNFIGKKFEIWFFKISTYGIEKIRLNESLVVVSKNCYQMSAFVEYMKTLKYFRHYLNRHYENWWFKISQFEVDYPVLLTSNPFAPVSPCSPFVPGIPSMP